MENVSYEFVFPEYGPRDARTIGNDNNNSALALWQLSVDATRYQPNWPSIDARPLPGWYDDVKIGIFIHWGVFSVPSYGSEWFWWNWQGAKSKSEVDFMKNNYRPDFTYADFAPSFTAELFNPNEWADILKASGAKYVVLTSKHHEGFTNWPSKVSFNWNSMEVGPKRDLVGELANKAAGFKTRKFVEAKTLPELYEIVTAYKPEVIWSDGDWEAPDTYWNSTSFLAWLYNDSPVKDIVVTNDRWGSGTPCHHGGYYTCHDKYNPGTLQKHKWENCMTIDSGSWGYRRNAPLSAYLTMDQLTQVLAETISCGGNLLINIGPTSDGRIIPIFEERLRQLGTWLKVNGDAIYSTKPWKHQNDTVTPNVWYTSKKSEKCENYISTSQCMADITVYAIVLDWPKAGLLELGAVSPASATTVQLLGYTGGAFKWTKRAGGGMVVDIPPIPANQMPCEWAWVFQLNNLP
ncbi:Alpha-L-fucosidase [Lamellibrachia satsuma]|nr:Alpha-L-fucosidase [Lamellibrachia satsuma]